MEENNNEEQCYCKSFDNKENYFSEYLRMFNTIASSSIKRNGNSLVESTNILKCKRCNTYYIWDSHNEEYSSDDKISARKYIPKTDDDGLRRILEKHDGIISEQSIDECSGLLEKLRNINLNRIDKERIDENMN